MFAGLNVEGALAQALLHSLWQDAILALLAWLVLATMSRRNAAARHAIGMLFLLAMVLAPLTTFIRLLAAATAKGRMPAATHAWSTVAASPLLPPAASVFTAPVWVPWLWVAGVLLMLLRMSGGWWMLRALDRRAFEPLPPAWRARAEALRQAMGIRREIAVRLLRDAGLPCSARAWRPVIWLPLAMLTQLAPEQVEALIAHELAHVRRLDWIWNGMQLMVEALLFYHPGVWWLSRRIRQEREHACDDLAVAACGDAIVLAEALAGLEQLRMPAHIFALGANGGSLMQRVKRLLSPDVPHRLRWSVPAGLLAVLCSGALLAAQVDASAAGSKPTAVPVAHWWNYVGNSVEFLTPGPDGLRDYHRWVDLSGKVNETYTVNGRPVTIDAGVRQWLAERQRELPVPPRPPLPSMPPPPPPPPLAAMPPPPPPPPMAYRAAVQLAQRDPRLVAMLGSPITVEGMDGRSHVDDRTADLMIPLSGPKGTTHLHAVGRRQGNVWRFSSLQIGSWFSHTQLDLAR